MVAGETDEFLLSRNCADVCDKTKFIRLDGDLIGLVYLRFLLARDSMLSALYAIANPSVCPSVCLSVRHTSGSVKNG